MRQSASGVQCPGSNPGGGTIAGLGLRRSACQVTSQATYIDKLAGMINSKRARPTQLRRRYNVDFKALATAFSATLARGNHLER